MDLAEIVAAYERGATVNTIALVHGVTANEICSILSDVGYVVTPPKPKHTYDVDEIIRRYETGESAQQISDDIGIASNTIGYILRDHSVQTRKAADYRRIDLEPYRAEIIARWRDGEKPKEIAKDYDCSYATISNRLREWGVKD